MTAKRKLPSPATLPVEVVWWKDVVRRTRQPLEMDPPVLVTVGATVSENDEVVVLAHEIESIADYTDEMDYTVIMKSLIVERKALGTVAVVLGSSQ